MSNAQVQPNHVVSVDPVKLEETAKAAYFRLLHEIVAQPAPTIRIVLDPSMVVTAVIGAHGRCQSLRAALVDEFRNFDAERFDQLDDYAGAFHYSHLLHQRATTPAPLPPELVKRGYELRDMLHADAAALVKRSVMRADAIKDVKKEPGHRPLISDLGLLELAFRELMPSLAGRSLVKEEELDEALTVAHALTMGVAGRDHSPAQVAEAKVIRHKAYALLLKLYDKFRSQVAALRHDFGDADTYMDTLYNTRLVARKVDASEEAPVEGPAEPPAGSVTGVHESVQLPALAVPGAVDGTLPLPPGAFKRAT